MPPARALPEDRSRGHTEAATPGSADTGGTTAIRDLDGDGNYLQKPILGQKDNAERYRDVTQKELRTRQKNIELFLGVTNGAWPQTGGGVGAAALSSIAWLFGHAGRRVGTFSLRIAPELGTSDEAAAQARSEAADALVAQAVAKFNAAALPGYQETQRTVCKSEWAYEVAVVFEGFDNFSAYMESDFRQNTTLRDLSISDNRIGEQGARHIAEGIAAGREQTAL